MESRTLIVEHNKRRVFMISLPLHVECPINLEGNMKRIHRAERIGGGGPKNIAIPLFLDRCWPFTRSAANLPTGYPLVAQCPNPANIGISALMRAGSDVHSVDKLRS